MKFRSKLKWDSNRRYALYFAILAVVYMLLTVLENHLFGTYYLPWVWGGVVIMFGFLFLRKSNVPGTLSRYLLFTMFILLGLAVWHYELAVHMDTFLSRKTWNAHIILMFAFFICTIPWFIWVKNRQKAHFRKIFELAARPVTEMKNGFTERPYPVSKSDLTREETIEFARFLESNMIAKPQFLEDRVLLRISSTMEYMMGRVEEDTSYVSLAFDGSVAVQISRKDYSQYKSEYSFEELCDNLAKLFLEFLDSYRRGEGDQIVGRLKGMESRSIQIMLYIAAFLLLGMGLVSMVLYLLS